MNSEQLKQIILKHPYLNQITPSVLSKAFKEVCNLWNDLDLDYTKTWGEQGFGDLDIIEMVMYLEKELNISIHDELIDTIFNTESYPINMTLLYREERLLELGI
jgi:acyl carrier protein